MRLLSRIKRCVLVLLLATSLVLSSTHASAKTSISLTVTISGGLIAGGTYLFWYIGYSERVSKKKRESPDRWASYDRPSPVSDGRTEILFPLLSIEF
ncbi:MAG: hypothetical protein ACE5GF_09805 [Thermodesulfobacteriota bacterium]